MKWLVSFPLVLALVSASYQVVVRLVALELSRRAQYLDQAIEFDGTNPEFFEQRADLRLNELRFQSYQGAGEDLVRATQLNPYYWKYWNDLARFQERIGELDSAEASYRKAIELSPQNGLYRWALFNYLLRQGRLDEALQELQLSLQLDEQLLSPGLDLLFQLGTSPERLVRLWPADARSTLFLINDLVLRPAPGAFTDRLLQLSFERLLTLEPVPIASLFGLIRYWDKRSSAEARRVWVQYLEKLGVQNEEFSRGMNLVWNGDFEHPLSEGGLGWITQAGSGAGIDRVAGQGYAGSAGLRIRIDSRNRAESGMIAAQLILAEPGRYEFSCRYRSDDNKANGRLRLTLINTGTGQESVLELEAQGSAQWKTVGVSTTITPGIISLRIESALSRAATPITFWIDDVRVAPS